MRPATRAETRGTSIFSNEVSRFPVLREVEQEEETAGAEGPEREEVIGRP